MLNLTLSQQDALNKMLCGGNIFLTGEAGTGKSTVIKAFISALERMGKNVLITAPTGVAALNIGGATLHRTFAAPVSVISPSEKAKVTSVLKNADVVVIDEISMCRIDLFEYVSKCIIKASKRNDIQVVVVGDFFQLPPVITANDKPLLEKLYPNMTKGFAFESTFWNDLSFTTIELREIIRQDDPIFVKYLNMARTGNVNCIKWFNDNANKKEIPNGIVLCGRNTEVDRINHDKLSLLSSEEYVYHSTCVGEVKNSDKVVDDELHMKKGARVMCLVNDPYDKYQNGSFGTVMNCTSESVDVLFDNGHVDTFNKHEWEINKYVLKEAKVPVKDHDEDGNEIIVGYNEVQTICKDVIGLYSQIPLKLAYAITIHKSQGQTFDKLNLYPNACFDDGQLYVALSRVKSIEGLSLLAYMPSRSLITNEKVKAFYKVNSQNIIDDNTKTEYALAFQKILNKQDDIDKCPAAIKNIIMPFIKEKGETHDS